ncbi:hypothetical protein GH714_019957 [Hevea brasiliensis]|uniref:Uncharacterized protein n=1 Tax=Hevea brasiliensis TaxID=3981 RepID=A0A6A6N1C5_HEVBR|nr:hypothetical protein GH714_019957 [Hevea brasiliensis]
MTKSILTDSTNLVTNPKVMGESIQQQLDRILHLFLEEQAANRAHQEELNSKLEALARDVTKVSAKHNLEGSSHSHHSNNKGNEGAVDLANDQPVEELPPEISLNAISGIHSPQAMKLEGNWNGETVFILIDSGSTHSFIDSHLAAKLPVQIDKKVGLRVMVANCETLSSPGTCRNVSLRLGIGAVLLQKNKPIYFSKVMAARHRKLPAYEKELIGLVKAVQH